jgi:hypothetical protein
MAEQVDDEGAPMMGSDLRTVVIKGEFLKMFFC